MLGEERNNEFPSSFSVCYSIWFALVRRVNKIFFKEKTKMNMQASKTCFLKTKKTL